MTNGSNEIRYSLNTKSGNNVKIMNIHKSKGLEFSLCYFVGLHNKFTIKDINDKVLFSSKYGIILPYMNEELEQVEIKVSYLEAQVAELNEVVIEQQKNIDAMNIKLLQVTKKLEELIEEVGSPSRPNRKPPHY